MSSRAVPIAFPPTEAAKHVFQPNFLRHKVAFVTGGGSGICKGMTLALMQFGCDTCITSRSLSRLEEAARDLEQKTGRQCLAVACDVRKPDTIEKAVDACLERFGRIDILINGAAGNFLASVNKLSYNAFRTVIEIDTLGTFNVTKAVYTKWMKKHGGNIVNCSMTGHYRAFPMWTHSATAKGGVDIMTRHMAVEWGPENIRVNAIAIGSIEGTVGMEKLSIPEFMERARKEIPLQRWGQISDIANATLFLVSDAASYVTGACFVVDGGSWMTASLPGYPEILSQM
jgi:peroxisomal 2,4-dienoyl-CoA reductase